MVVKFPISEDMLRGTGAPTTVEGADPCQLPFQTELDSVHAHWLCCVPLLCPDWIECLHCCLG